MISPVPDIRTLDLDPKLDSFVFLACDGIWNSLSSQEVADFITERLDKAKKATPEVLKTICVEVTILGLTSLNPIVSPGSGIALRVQLSIRSLLNLTLTLSFDYL
jgi:hypothetical protein